MDTVTRVSKSWTKLMAFLIALITLGEGMNSVILPLAMGKIVGQGLCFFSLGKATSPRRRRNSELKTCLNSA